MLIGHFALLSFEIVQIYICDDIIICVSLRFTLCSREILDSWFALVGSLLKVAVAALLVVNWVAWRRSTLCRVGFIAPVGVMRGATSEPCESTALRLLSNNEIVRHIPNFLRRMGERTEFFVWASEAFLAQFGFILSRMVLYFLNIMRKRALFLSLTLLSHRAHCCDVLELWVILSEWVSPETLLVFWVGFEALIPKRAHVDAGCFLAGLCEEVKYDAPVTVLLSSKDLHQLLVAVAAAAEAPSEPLLWRVSHCIVGFLDATST